MKKIILLLIGLYRKFISPIIVGSFGHACRFSPTCSEYAQNEIQREGIVKGGWRSVVRLSRCNPFYKQ
ncbi:membrane protein insertion efficiency factor YidD [Patescibacteria group bacterium]